MEPHGFVSMTTGPTAGPTPALAPCAEDHSPPLPPSGILHLWHYQWGPDTDEADIRAHYALLNSGERRRTDRFKVEHARIAATLSSGILRRRIGSYLDRPPTVLSFRTGPHGKPYLAGEDQAVPLMFNISHSGPHILMAFTSGEEIGVDVEIVRDRKFLQQIADRHYHDNELTDIRWKPAAEQEAEFYRYWTMKEAWIKALGVGLRYPIQSLDFSRQMMGAGETYFEAEDRSWWCSKLDGAENARAAVVVERRAAPPRDAEGGS